MNISTSTIDQILIEAHQRAHEIMMLGTQEAASLSARLVAVGKTKVEEQFGQLTRQQFSLRKIARSEVVNRQRMLRIEAKYNLCEAIFREVQLRLAKISQKKGEEYQLFLVGTIADGLVRMFEQTIAIRCREEDKILLNSLIPHCSHAYGEYMKEQVGIEFPVSVRIAENSTLESRTLQPHRTIDKKEEDEKCIGGVILADGTGNITFKATFDSRLAILKEMCLPELRTALWGEQLTNSSI